MEIIPRHIDMRDWIESFRGEARPFRFIENVSDPWTSGNEEPNYRGQDKRKNDIPFFRLRGPKVAFTSNPLA